MAKPFTEMTESEIIKWCKSNPNAAMMTICTDPEYRANYIKTKGKKTLYPDAQQKWIRTRELELMSQGHSLVEASQRAVKESAALFGKKISPLLLVAVVVIMIVVIALVLSL